MSDTVVAIAGHIATGCTLTLAVIAGYVVQLCVRRWLEIRRGGQ